MENKEMEVNYNLMFSNMVKKFDLHKKQSTSDTLIKKGEIQAIGKALLLVESQIKAKFLEKAQKLKSYKDDITAMKKFKIEIDGPKLSKELYSTYTYLRMSKQTLDNDLLEAKAIEKVFDKLNINLEDSLRDLDLLNKMKENTMPKDIQIRVDSGKCAFKRPGRVKFPCDCELVPGTKYCKDHLKQFNPDVYINLFDSESEGE